ncbi:MAG: hypothetical protein QXW91_04140 [Candidatus Nitrosotenuis sp.]
MSQMLFGSQRGSVLYSELHHPKQKQIMKSSAKEVLCHICLEGLKEGSCMAAKVHGGKLVFVCSIHSC